MHRSKAFQLPRVILPLSYYPKRPHYIRPSVISSTASETPFPKLGRIRFFSGGVKDQVTLHGVDPHSYTSGRWLRNDNHERHIRLIDFDFMKLCQRVLGLFDGAKYIKNCEKKEGGFNRVFIFTMDDGSRAVARLPFRFAGPAKLATASEVATMEYLRRKTGIPIPRILDWSDDATNCIGSEYIIMEHVSGIQLHQKWPSMAGDQKVKCIDAIYGKLKKVADIGFPAYGSLYFSTSSLGFFSTVPIEDGFCLGPHCGTRYWDCGDRRYYEHGIPNHGPWLTISAFVDGLVDAGLSRTPPRDHQLSNRPSYQGSIKTHLDLLEHGRTVLKAMSADTRVHDAAVPTLFHPDLHKRNIFVSEGDPSVITGITDWQSSSIEPAFWYTNEVPDFATCSSRSGPSAQNGDDHEVCAEAYDICTQLLTPRLAHPRLMNENLFRPFRYCYRTWKDGVVAFRHELIQISKEWEALELSGTCPFPWPGPEQADMHRKEYKRFEVAQNLKRDLSSLFCCASDGWVPLEGWEVAKEGNRTMYKGILQAALENKDPEDDEPIRTEGDLRDIWPFDLPEEDLC